MSITFRYKKIERPTGLNYVPYIPISIIGDDKIADFTALLDSGADVSVLPKEVADALGLKYSEKEEDVIGIGGKIKARVTSIHACIDYGHEKVRILLHPKVVDDVNIPIILGRDFFEKFEITLKENERKIVSKKI
jgi:predicted aspartyl protease